jgi:mannan endo-1,4-beta-mannosidase
MTSMTVRARQSPLNSDGTSPDLPTRLKTPARACTVGVVKPFALNLMTCALTVVLLVALALPARQAYRTARESSAPSVPDAPWPRPASDPRRVFGAYIDPWHLDDWARSVGAAPQMIAKFEAFSLRRAPVATLAQAERVGIKRVLISWEPWAPVPTSFGTARQALPQPGYRNIDIARGAQDRYILAFARALARFHGTVYVRYAHEMNGYWYPWSHGSEAYIWAWRRIVRIFDVAHARNVRFVWSVNPNLYDPEATWKRSLMRYWPGRGYVDDIGSTMINFGGAKSYPVAEFAPRLRWLHDRFGKRVVLTEVNTAYADRVAWLRDLRSMLAGMPWIPALAWSQLPSRGKAHQLGTGVLDWHVEQDPAAGQELHAIIDAGLR